MLCPLFGGGSGGRELQCVASTRYSLYYKEIFVLHHLDFSGICGVNSYLAVLVQVSVHQKGTLGDSQQMHALWGQIFLQNFVWALSPSITVRKKIGGFQRLTSVLRWWLTTMVTKREGGLTENWVLLCEEWDWRKVLFEGREANSPESTAVWLCYSHCFPSLTSIPLCMDWVTLVIASWTSWGKWYRQLPSALRASVTGVMERGNEMPVCWGKTPSEEEENLFAEVFPLIPSFLQHSSSLLGNVFHIAIALRLVRLWIIVCMLIRIYCFLPLKWTKTLPLSIFNLEKSTLFPLCCPLPFPFLSFVQWGVVADPLCSLCSLFPLLPEV